MSAMQRTRNFSISKDLSQERKEVIDRLVESVRLKIAYEQPPLTLSQIEIAIPEIQICEMPHSPVASQITYLDPNKLIAQINIRSKDTQQNKVLHACHALGHYYLHARECFACRLDFYGQQDPQEIEATYFAETLMMPLRLVTELYRSLSGDYDPVYKLAKCFSVKRQIMQDRLTSLDLL